MPTVAPMTQNWVRRALGHLLTGTLATLGAMSTALGAGLSMIGLCCTPLAATAAAGGAAAGGGAAVAPTTWPFWTVGAVLLTAAMLWHRRRRVGAVCRARRAGPTMAPRAVAAGE